MNEERVVGGLTTVDALLDLGPMGFIQQFADDTVDYNLDGVKKYAELGLLTEAHGAALTPDGVAALNTPAIQECIDGGFITVEQALNLTTAGRASFCNEAIFSNIKTGRIFIDSVLNKQFTMTTCSSLLRYPWIPAKTKGQGC
jgi:hypothetical protein